ncbi:MAG: aminotransferase class III-fold pyridoxal phosphate-dependent enzyme, partial [Rhodobacteraceae bacterium]|nr:aminotransferase class III-fold pyridoxal phosphate-dependent enzyme [Paracoccaceae bacterium]
VAAIVSSNENIGIFRKRFRYFNTFGGNPVAMAAAQSTLKVIEEENLVQHAYKVGQRALHKLNNLVAKYDCLGVARGSGLFFGAEVCDGEGNPDAHMTKLIVNSMREKGVLINSLGRHKSILKIRPPLPIENQEIDFLINTLDEVLDSLARSHN